MKTLAAALITLSVMFCVSFSAAPASAAQPPPDQYLKTTVDEVSRIVQKDGMQGLIGKLREKESAKD